MSEKRWARGVLGWVAAAGMAGACAAAPDAAFDQGAGDASVTPSLGPASIAEEAAALAAPRAEVAAVLAAGGGFRRTSAGLTSPGWFVTGSTPERTVGSVLPERADGPLRVGVGASEAVSLQVSLEGAVSVPVALDQGRAVYPGAWRSTDLVVGATRERLEWLYLVRDPAGPSTFRFRVALGAELPHGRLTADGGLEFLDPHGSPQLGMPPPVALDATGLERPVEVTFHDGVVELVLDTRGLSYPILLDPAIEVGVWERRSGPPGSSTDPLMVYDPVRARTVLAPSNTSSPETWTWDGAGWLLKSVVGPQPRWGAVGAWDSTNQRVLMFSGAISGLGDTNQLWSWDGTSWTQLCTGFACESGAPAARRWAAGAYDPVRSRLVVFGGETSGVKQNDVWEYDGTSWAQRCTAAPCNSTRPTARSGTTSFHDAVSNAVLFFGGTTGAGDSAQTWMWDGTAWTLRAPATSPSARTRAPGVWRGSVSKGFLQSGYVSFSVNGESWEWNGTTWTQLFPANPDFGGGPIAWDSARARVVTAGYTGVSEYVGGNWVPDLTYPPPGYPELALDEDRGRVVYRAADDTWQWNGFSWARTCPGAGCTADLVEPGNVYNLLGWDGNRRRVVSLTGANTLWEFDGSGWTKRVAAAMTSGHRWSGSMTFDEARSRLVHYGGRSNGGTMFAETWLYDGTSWTQTCTVAPCATTKPLARLSAAMTYDRTRQVVVLFGGMDPFLNVAYGDTWEWNGTAWVQRSTTGPSARSHSALGYDPIRGKTILFGGRNVSGLYFDDTWEWNGTTWTSVTVSGPKPTPRETRGLFDGARSRFLIAGPNADVWEYHTRGAACGAAGSCDTGHCVDGVCCESAICGTCQACNLAGTDGYCASVQGADDPDSCAVSTDTCDALGRCRKKNGQMCAGADQCASGFCVDGYCCGTACDQGCGVCNVTPGTCTPRAVGTGTLCGGYLCDGASQACPSSCADDSGCTGTHYCAATGKCEPRRAQGAPCNTGTGGDCRVTGCSECSGGNLCVDFVCCSSTCAGTCQSCNAGTPGTCTTLTSGQDPGTCTGANQCVTGGACRKQNGQACAAGTECASGFCADSVCCNAACGGGCDSCGSGTCTVAAAGSAGVGCGNYLCGGSAGCPTSCTGDGGCTAATYCRTSDSTCQPDQANGAACTSGSQCTSGNCVDGVCCATTCTGACQACSNGKTGAASGTCAPVLVGTDPDSECAQSAATTCGLDGTCNGAGACRQYVSGTSCGTTTCSAGTQSVFTCNGSGTCGAAPTACSPFACGSGGCLTVCAGDTDCQSGYYCATGGACLPKGANGGTCGAANQCTSGFCVDGVCCNAACTGTCEACTLARTGTASGTCSAVTAGTDPDSECATDTTTSCQRDGFCNGARACRLYASGTSCGTSTCSGATTQTNYTCNGVGTCSGAGVACGAGYACVSGSCAVSCTADAQCAGGYYCRTSDGTCQAKLAQGGACTAATQCASGNCVDGFCCDAPCAGTCQACSAARKGSGSNGVCGNIVVDTDPDGECSADGSNVCGQTGNCSGTGTCKLAASGASCGSTTCANAVQTGQQCNGAGLCQTGLSVPCTTGYACLNASVCATACSSDAQCTAAYYCRGSDGTCQPDQAVGAACTAAGQCQSGSCVDGVCCDSPCTGLCQACSAALKGSGANGVCGAIVAGTDPGSECAVDGVSLCGQTGACNGSGACQLAASGTVCGTTTCAAAIQTGQQCNGSGQCVSGSSTPCGTGYQCLDASVCAASCSTDGQCSPTHHCRASDGTCQPDRPAGGACTGTSQCQSGYCVDGVCCDAPCTGTCQACTAAKKGAGADGTCGPVTVDTDPDGECSAETPSTCGQNGQCDGAGQCKRWPFGTNCGVATCAGGLRTGFACNGTGTCVAGTSTQCAPYECGAGGECAASCTSDAQCVPTFHCRLADGTCQADLPQGTACGAASQCQSGQCVDGVCCDAPCGGACEACSAALKGAGADGTCGPVAADTDPAGDCSPESAATCGRTGQCDGAGQCRLHAPGISCGSTVCSGGQQTGYACDGFGGCQPGSTTPCAPYVCGASGTCAQTCGTDVDCVASAFCDQGSGQCRTDQVNGAACTLGTQCLSGFCVDGVCCAQACNGLCEACSAALKGSGADGVCGAVAAATDPQAECVDEGPDSCRANGFCNGFGQCGQYAAGTACGSTTCTPSAAGGTQTGYTCNGSGTCVGSASTPCAPYNCQGDRCGAACVADADCIATHHCRLTDGTCQADLGLGAACAGSAQCLSGNCVDGLCCDSPCDGACEACAAGLTGDADGVCAPTTAGTDPDDDCAADDQSTCQKTGTCDGTGRCSLHASGTACGVTTCAPGASGGVQTGYACDGLGSCVTGQTTSCAPYLCQGTACGVTCGDDTGCVASSHCAGGVCLPDQPLGGTCSAASQCVSGFCVDGVCCNAACGGTCQACTTARTGVSTGTCAPVTAGTDPDGDCTIAAPSTCALDGTCDGAGACKLWAPGTSCGTNTCGGSLGSTLTGQQCDGFGTCVAGQATLCDPFRCLGDSCLAACSDDSQCVATAWCSAGTCVPRVANGAACTAAAGCLSGFCVEGVCCNTACDGICQSCTATGKGTGADGVCGLAADGADPQGSCATDAPTTCQRDGTCDGAGACRLWPDTTACGTTSCVGNVQTGFFCNGLGVCNPGSQTDCGEFACSGGACRTSCAADGDCASGHYCDLTAGACLPRSPSGSVCATASECESGFCVDGVCCDQACSGQCQACDVAGAVGRCSAVIGAPHGSRPACDTGAAGEACSARTCDGQDMGSCSGYVGSQVACRDASCSGGREGTETFSGTCNGFGQCGALEAPVSRPCFPFACGADACLTACTVTEDCAQGNICQAGTCVSGNTCLDEFTLVDAVGREQSCAPYTCVGGACQTTCDTTVDCLGGFVCSEGACVLASGGRAAAAGDDGGCGCRTGSRDSGASVLGALVVAGLAFARRRRTAGVARRRPG